MFFKMSRKTQRVVLKSQAREIISKVYDFMKKEASNNYAEKITDARWRTAQAVGVSESTVTRILRERKVCTSTMKQTTVPDIETNIKMESDEIVPTVSRGEQTTEPTTKPDIKSEKEATNNYAEKITDARWRTAQAVGVSESTVTRILGERKVCTSTMKQTTVPAIGLNIKMEPDEIVPTVSSAEQTTELTTEVDIKSENEWST